jgi:hypothetical protein
MVRVFRNLQSRKTCRRLHFFEASGLRHGLLSGITDVGSFGSTDCGTDEDADAWARVQKRLLHEPETVGAEMQSEQMQRLPGVHVANTVSRAYGKPNSGELWRPHRGILRRVSAG